MPHRRLIREVTQDVSPLVRTLAASYWSLAVVRGAPRALIDLCETAHHLTADFADYETPARAAGWKPEPGDTLGRVYLDTTARDGEDESYYHAADWLEACNRLGLEPAWLPVLQWWAVSPWLAERLHERGERVDELADIWIWARTAATDLHDDELLRAIWRSTTNLHHERNGDSP